MREDFAADIILLVDVDGMRVQVVCLVKLHTSCERTLLLISFCC